MKFKPTNPPAFPAAAYSPMGDQWLQEGMSLRDHFAGQAAASIIGGLCALGTRTTSETAEMVAKSSYALADAMLAERERSK